MSIQFSDTDTNKGLVQFYETECGFSHGDISSDDDRLKDFAASTNVAFDEFLTIAFPRTGTWQFDDSNHTDYPIIKTNIVSGQRDYPFTTDENGNIILDIYKVAILQSATATLYQKIDTTDEQSEPENYNLISETTATGVPTSYDKTGNAIRFDIIPGYNAANGLKVYINREGSYFVYTDTTKMPGVPGTLHSWFYLRPAQDYIRLNGTDAAYTKITREVERVKAAIKETFSQRAKDEKPVMRGKKINFI